jgi:cytochrome c biogenesis protein CcmG, thiol:disulfide interchange protein DsbE
MEISGKTLAALGAFLVLAALLLFAASYELSHPHQVALLPNGSGDRESTEGTPPVPAGDIAGEFKLEDAFSGQTVSLSSLKGKVVFLNVWATWCGPCREEMPSMETLYDELKSNKDFVMLAVSQDTKGKSVVVPYVEKNGYHFKILLDPENKVGESYSVSGVPETFIIDRNGRIVAHHMGAFDWSRPDVKEALQQLLSSKPANAG